MVFFYTASEDQEFMVIECENLNEKSIIHGGVFMIPLGNNRYRVGSYNWRDQADGITKGARISLQTKLNKIVRNPYQIINQSAGFRPTTPDRRPVIGVHQIFPNLLYVMAWVLVEFYKLPFVQDYSTTTLRTKLRFLRKST